MYKNTNYISLYKIRRQSGDTIIEVLLALSIFAAVLVAASFVMNRGLGTAQRSLEVTQVTNQIGAQSDMIRHLLNIAIAGAGKNQNGQVVYQGSEFDKILGKVVGSAPSFDKINDNDITNCTPSYVTNMGGNPFFLTPEAKVAPFNSVTASVPETFARVSKGGSAPGGFTSQMVWVYAVKNKTTIDRQKLAGDYIDFHIRACWFNPDGGGVQKLGTIVRLYEQGGVSGS